MSDDILKMKHHKLLFELKFLYADLEYHQTMQNHATQKFQEEFLKYSEENKTLKIMFPDAEVPPPTKGEAPQVDNEEIFKIDKKKISKEVAELYKKVVSVTHPDKSINLSKQEKRHRKSVFLKASEAAQEDNLFALQQIALDLGFELSSPTENQIQIFEKEAEKIKHRIKDITKTYAWSWHMTAENERKGQIMEEYNNLMVFRAAEKSTDDD